MLCSEEKFGEISQWNTETSTLKMYQKKHGICLAVQWLRLCALSAGGTGSVPGWETKIPHAARYGKKKYIIKNKK